MEPMPEQLQRRLETMDAYGRRAMDYVAANCPTRYAQIADPVSFFWDLGEQMRSAAMEAQESLTPAPSGDRNDAAVWLEALGQANMARLQAEELVFSEMLWAAFPAETEEDEEPAWTPLMPDFSEIAQAEAEDIHL
jgi:hypothetical protein